MRFLCKKDNFIPTILLKYKSIGYFEYMLFKLNQFVSYIFWPQVI